MKRERERERGRRERGQRKVFPPLSSVSILTFLLKHPQEQLPPSSSFFLVVFSPLPPTQSIQRQIEFRLGSLKEQGYDRKQSTGVRQRRVAAALQRYVVDAIYRDKVNPILIANNIEILEVRTEGFLCFLFFFFFSSFLFT